MVLLAKPAAQELSVWTGIGGWGELISASESQRRSIAPSYSARLARGNGIFGFALISAFSLVSFFVRKTVRPCKTPSREDRRRSVCSRHLQRAQTSYFSRTHCCLSSQA